jgi:hypothetical protein
MSLRPSRASAPSLLGRAAREGPSNEELALKIEELNAKLELLLQKIEVVDMRVRSCAKPPPPPEKPSPGDVEVTLHGGFV